MSHGPEGAQCEYNINNELKKQIKLINEICEDDAKEMSNWHMLV